jgi:hypothetical protein
LVLENREVEKHIVSAENNLLFRGARYSANLNQTLIQNQWTYPAAGL